MPWKLREMIIINPADDRNEFKREIKTIQKSLEMTILHIKTNEQ